MGLTERLQHFHEAIAWKGEIPLQSRYTLGIAGTRFFEEIRDNARLMAARCPECGFTYMPPRLYCERCFAEAGEWVEIAPQGTVYAYTVMHLNLDEEPLPAPEVIAFVRFPDCQGGLIHRMDGVDPEEMFIGMPVEVVFAQERKGSLEDIVGFRPI